MFWVVWDFSSPKPKNKQCKQKSHRKVETKIKFLAKPGLPEYDLALYIIKNWVNFVIALLTILYTYMAILKRAVSQYFFATRKIFRLQTKKLYLRYYESELGRLL